MLQKEVNELRKEVAAYQQDALSGRSSLEIIEEKLTQIENLAGLSAVNGPGVEIKLFDAARGAIDIGPSGLGAEAYIIHDQDIMLLINELKAAGAEAISIKSGDTEERIVSSTFIRCTGPTVIVNNTKMASPFTVKAIGDPDVLESALEIPEGLADQLKVFGIKVTISKLPKVAIPGYAGSRVFTYASPETARPDGGAE